MCSGIDMCTVFVVCLTRRYIDSCANMTTNSNCRIELDYAYERRGGNRMLVVVMERGCLDTRTWNGPVGAYLAKRFYTDACGDITVATAQRVRGAIRSMLHAPVRPSAPCHRPPKVRRSVTLHTVVAWVLMRLRLLPTTPLLR
jgi:hypothetical protein